MTDVGVAATQMTCSWDRAENLNRAEKLVRQAATAGASIILLVPFWAGCPYKAAHAQ